MPNDIPEQVTSEHNFSILAAYCSSFAGDLPTKKEAEAETGSILRCSSVETTGS